MRVEKNAHIAGDYELFGVLLRIVGNTFDEQATLASNVLPTTAKKNAREKRQAARRETAARGPEEGLPLAKR